MNEREKEFEFIRKVQKFNDTKSYDTLRIKYNNLIISESYIMTRKFPSIPLTLDDLKNLLTFYFYKVILNYDKTRGMSFGVYAKQHLRFMIMNHIRTLINKNNAIMNYKTEYFDDHFGEEIDETKDIAIEHLNKVKNNFKEFKFLKEIEKKYLKIVFEQEKIDIKYISKKLNIPSSTTYDLKRRISKKLKTHLEL